MAYNHPSGDLTPSREDIEVTRRPTEAGDVLGIKVLDHIIVDTERGISAFSRLGLYSKAIAEASCFVVAKPSPYA